MFENIPTYVLAGPLGAGKTSVAQHWLSQRPAGERWAVLVNEFGDIGLDAALIGPSADGISVVEVAGGCICCVNGAPFTVALGRLIKAAKPHRLLIELSGLSHPLPLLAQLRSVPWNKVLALQPLVIVLDGQRLQGSVPLADSLKAALRLPCIVAINKADTVPVSDRPAIEQSLGHKGQWITQGRLNWEAVALHSVAQPPAVLPRLLPLAAAKPTPEWSIGWQMEAEHLIALERVEALLNQWPWTRAKMVLHSPDGWYSANLVPGQPIQWACSEWRRDSRLEMIFDEVQPEQALNSAWLNCRLS
ncbi:MULTISPECIES: CobW family GTP-binding protein [Pseudomonas]|uniref:Cobalamin biosynthesis protein CobW n=1 Tax=Pseudomonas quercus TaxID=2722792 RepID=A0ABX0YHH7_9PSED|nr:MULTISPECIES: CobW-like GTP-binding protein [Pseudomonas]MBF7144357.1 cobalamin biosynthesis protein CobW [Pseudomonas sp. LY10J]NJP02896.1 cobalamin biosynthesis protein CobW [Pseudomonas quercus]